MAVLAGALGWSVSALLGGRSNTASGGHILLLTSARLLALGSLDGTGLTQFVALGTLGGSQAFAAPGGRLLLSDAGDTVTLRDGRPVKHSTPLYQTLDSTGLIRSAAPFADGAADIVFSTNFDPDTPQSQINLVPVGGGRPRALGAGVTSVGDPQQAAAFVTVAARPSSRVSEGQMPAVTAIVHRVAGGAASTVVTTAQVGRDLGLTGAAALSLNPLPDPTGRFLAVGAYDVKAAVSRGLVVYTRAGRLVARASATPTGPLAWNPAGTKLLYSTARGAVVWVPGGSTEQLSTSSSAAMLQGCVWSPDGSRAVCLGYSGQRQSYDAWVVVDLAKRTATAHPPAGIPLLWVK